VARDLGLAPRLDPFLPRAVNNLAVRSLITAFATNKGIVDESSAQAGRRL
jgi:type II secretory pathway predicted ATPase ExeA